jgi:exonuclease SbcC
LNKDIVVKHLRTALDDFSGARLSTGTQDECPTSEFVLKTDCFLSFFAVIERGELLADSYVRAQGEIIRAQSTKGVKWPRDLNLVLLIAEDTPANSTTIRELVDDRYVCRKFVLAVNGGDIREVLSQLPFWPPGKLLTGSAVSIATGVQEAIGGYDPNLITELASHSPGAQRIAKKIQENAYHVSGEHLKSPVVPEITSARKIYNRLTGLEISNFRGIRRLQREAMSLAADVVFIYGPNGVGKTSIADAVEWVISGEIARLQSIPDIAVTRGPNPIVNVFADNGQAKVTCYLSNGENISRIQQNGETQQFIGSRSVRDDRDFIDHVVGTKAPSSESRLRIERLRDLFRGSHMLSQHNIRQFLQQTGPERFDILTNMIGAEEFVRFREKVGAVLQYLRSDTNVAIEEAKSQKRELEDVSTRLRERRKDLEGLSQTIASGKSLSVLTADLLQCLKDYECSIDNSAIQKARTESAEREAELIAVHADVAIRRKKAAVQDLLLRLHTLQAELEGYVDSKAHCETLAAEIGSVETISKQLQIAIEKDEGERQKIRALVDNAKTKQTQASRRHAALAWLKQNVSVYRRAQDALRHNEQPLLKERETFQKSEAVLREQQNTLNEKRARLVTLERTISFKATRDRALLNLLNRLTDVLTKSNETAHLERRATELDSKLTELQASMTSAVSALNVSQGRLDELQRLYGSEAARNDVLNSLLARLQEFVRSADCPLCGRPFSSTEDAKSKIREHLSTVPVQLRDLAGALDRAAKERENMQAQVDSLSAGIRALHAESQELLSHKTIAEKTVLQFVANCRELNVSLPTEDTSTWKHSLEEARKAYGVDALQSEAAKIPGEISTLTAGIAERESIVAQCKQKMGELERERGALLSQIRELEAEITARGFDTGSPPEDSQLIGQFAETQEETKQFSDLLVTKNAELAAVEALIAEHRQMFRNHQQDIASKQTQLQQYQRVCSHFVAGCRALSIDLDRPRERISDMIQRMEKLGQSVASLDQQVQIILQVVSMTKLRMEVTELGRTEQSLKGRVEAATSTNSQLQNWVSHLTKLQTDVVSRQVDVVGAHLEDLGPTTQQLYQRLNPHPIFGHLRLRVDEKKHELDIEATASVRYERLRDITVSPSAFFSDAQLNTLAITVFLAGALRQRWSGFNAILIDDPIQQMDEMNVNAFLDLIRGLSDHRQFIIFTCSRDFYLLALDKLDCLNKSRQGTFLAYRLEGIAPAELKVHCDTN